ncbi:MAG: copper amine oxidase N-terminal domain-containing protein [Aminipila sp.]
MKKMFLIVLVITVFMSCNISSIYGAEVEVERADSSYDEESAKNIVKRIDEYVEPYLGLNILINYDNSRAIQCHAFTNYIWRNVYGYDVYSSKCRRTEASSDYDSLGEYVNKYARPGDMLRVDGKHSMVITEIDDDSVTGYDWISNKKERKCTYDWEGVKNWGDGTQKYWLYQMDDSAYNLFADSDYKIEKLFGPTPDREGDKNQNEDKDKDKDDESDQNKGGEDGGQDDDKNGDSQGRIVVQINNPIMTANGQYKDIDTSGTTPIIVNDRAVLPIRAIVETMGGNVEWNNETRTIGLKYKDTILKMTIDSNIMNVNGKDVNIDVAPIIVNDRTMLPIRYVTESFGGEVEWFDSIQAIAITYKI